MTEIAQEAQLRQRMMKYWEHHGVEETANRYHVCRKTVWKWKRRWDGTAASLEERSRRPHSFPRAQEPWEIKLVRRMRKKYAEDLLLGYQKACQYGYKRSYGCFKRKAVHKIPPKGKPKKRKNKPYQRAEYPGQKVQIDVKYVPSYCVADGKKYDQYTAKDECTRWTYREMFAERSTHSPQQFLLSLIAHAPFMIREVQTDNGAEFTKRLISNDPNNKTSVAGVEGLE